MNKGEFAITKGTNISKRDKTKIETESLDILEKVNTWLFEATEEEVITIRCVKPMKP